MHVCFVMIEPKGALFSVNEMVINLNVFEFVVYNRVYIPFFIIMEDQTNPQSLHTLDNWKMNIFSCKVIYIYR